MHSALHGILRYGSQHVSYGFRKVRAYFANFSERMRVGKATDSGRWSNIGCFARCGGNRRNPYHTLTIGPEGQIVIPAELQRELQLKSGVELVARAEDGKLVLETRDAIIKRIRASLAHIPSDRILSEELIAERREEARREAEE